MIDRATIDKIMDAANIVDVVSEFVTLQKRGASYKGLCPFHDDHTPSFSVSPARGVYKCFSCGESGNVVNFIMKHEQKTYPEALRWLANKYHIEIQDRELTEEERKQANERESLFLVNEWAAKYFEDILHNHEDGRAIGMQYFRSRGFRDDTIRKFRLGYCLKNPHAMSEAALKEGFQREYLIKTGLCYERDNGDLIDRFAGRVIFPWITMSERVVGFTGRVLDSRTHGVNMKYVNSPDSEIYHKTNELYGINLAKREMSKKEQALLVEGQADVISLHQSGITNVVAGSGTALTIPQIKLLHRFTPNVTLVYDGDEAGQKAALRGTDMLLSERMNVKVLFLPEGMDPDDFAKSRTVDQLQAYFDEHQTDFIVFEINALLANQTDPIRRAEAIGKIVHSIAVIKDPIIRATYLRECANRTGVKEDTLIQQMNRYIYTDREQKDREERRQQLPEPAPAQVINEATPMQQTSKVEQMIIETIIRSGHVVILEGVEDANSGELLNLTVAQYVAYDLGSDNLTFHNPVYNQILQEAADHSGDPDFVAETYFLHHPNPEISTLAAQISATQYALFTNLKVEESTEKLRDSVLHLLIDFRTDYVEHHLAELQKLLLGISSADTDQYMALLQEIKDMQTIRNELAKKKGTDIL